MGVASTVGKVALKGGKFLSKGNVLTFLGSVIVSEVLAHIMDKAAGDPEAAVQAILTAGQKKAAIEATMATTQPQEVQESVAQTFKGIRPDKRLTEMALQRRGVIPITPDDQPVLSYVAAKLGMDPTRLIALSNPSRMGDYSELGQVLTPAQKDS